MLYAKKSIYSYFFLLYIIILNCNVTGAVVQYESKRSVADITIDKAYIKLPYKDSSHAVGYMSVSNNTSTDIYLLNVTAPDLCNDVLIHNILPDSFYNIHKIIPITELLIPAYSTVNFSSGKLYFMLLNLKKKMFRGKLYSINLFFSHKMIPMYFEVK